MLFFLIVFEINHVVQAVWVPSLQTQLTSKLPGPQKQEIMGHLFAFRCFILKLRHKEILGRWPGFYINDEKPKVATLPPIQLNVYSNSGPSFSDYIM